MPLKETWWVVTDLDGTLMDHNYDISPAIDTLYWLEDIGIPVIPCTSKTAAEAENFRAEFGLRDPYIVENGGAVYGNNPITSIPWELALGRTHDNLRPLLDRLSKDIGYQLRALEDIPYVEIENLTGLKGKAIDQACDRKWSVPFLNPPVRDLIRLNQLANKLEATIVQGNRMCHLLGIGSHKGRAVNELKKFLHKPEAKIIALGDSQIDLPLLEVAVISIVVPNKDGPHHSYLKNIQQDQFLLAPEPHSAGWAKAVRNCINQLQ